MKRKVIVLSSYVVNNARANVGFNKKFLKLCVDTFGEAVFITSNYPPYHIMDLDGLTLENIPIDWINLTQKQALPKYILMQLKCIGLIRKYYHKGDLVVFWLSGPMILPFLYAKLTGKKTLSYLYGNTKFKGDRRSCYNSLVGFLTGFMGKHATYMGVETSSVLKQWHESYDARRTIDTHLYVDLDKFRPTVPTREREKLVGMSCRMMENKKPLETIRAFHALRDRLPDWKLEIAGDGPLLDACKALVETLGERNRIRILGWVDNDEMDRYYARWQLLLFPSNYEGLSNSVIESMCCATPVLASPVGGLPDVIEDGKTGWYLHATTAEAMEEQLYATLMAPDFYQVADNALHFARTMFAYDATLANFRDKMEKIR